MLARLKSHSCAVWIAVLVIVASVAAIPRLSARIDWNPDSLYYQAQMYEIRGDSESSARAKAFSTGYAAYVKQHDPQVADPAWQEYSAPFYRRRWLVPVFAAAVYPIAGDEHSLVDVSTVGYVLIGPLLFLLLRRRFSDPVSGTVAAFCLLLPPVRYFMTLPMTDSWGIVLELGALLAALLALERAGRWIAVWVVTVLALAFTRDLAVVALVAVAAIALMRRDRRSAVVLASGVVAASPAYLFFGAPLVKQLAWMMQGFRIPHDESLSWVASHYPSTILDVLHHDAVYPGGLSFHLFWYGVEAAIIAMILVTVVAAPRRDDYFVMERGLLLGAAIPVALAAGFTGLRVELAFLPVIAIATGFAFEAGVRSVRGRIVGRAVGLAPKTG